MSLNPINLGRCGILCNSLFFSAIVGDGRQEESNAEDADQSKSVKDTEGKTELSEGDKSEEVSEKLDDGEYDTDEDVEEDLEDTKQEETEVNNTQV